MTYYPTLVNGLTRWRKAIAASLGVADADKLIKTNSSGILDETLLPIYPLSLIEGLDLRMDDSGNPTYLKFGAGVATVLSGTTRYLARSSGIFYKNLAATWSAGSNNGGRFVATAVAANQTWHCFIIRNQTTKAIDFGFDSSLTGANVPSGWNARIIGSIMTDGSAAIRAFTQVWDTVYWKDEVQDYRASLGTTATAITLTVPSGMALEAIVRLASGLPTSPNTNAILLSSYSMTDVAPTRLGGGAASVESAYVAGGVEFEASVVERILTSGQSIRARASFGSYIHFPRIATIGFVHPRGQV
ncbi:MAG: hypothetical protein KME15_19870 [Drouetiella hepatica Uher 2000/2452]|jgi:hypothetical protein|uniref:Uncharacterized protein n=1 Tax=Drouetiella hepatica Uher 2000/2452 TaxID=904376 RepID=A0A951QFF2_9CYAN|nr:hypothetical protein [Drouetiella hepatica Uher 2000/2452]